MIGVLAPDLPWSKTVRIWTLSSQGKIQKMNLEAWHFWMVMEKPTNNGRLRRDRRQCLQTNMFSQGFEVVGQRTVGWDLWTRSWTWRVEKRIPVDFQPEYGIKTSLYAPLSLYIIVLPFAYSNCLYTIYQTSIRHSYWINRSRMAVQEADPEPIPLDPRVFTSTTLCICATRSWFRLVFTLTLTFRLFIVVWNWRVLGGSSTSLWACSLFSFGMFFKLQ